MSGEFGNWFGGWHHWKIKSAQEDTEGALYEVTRITGRFLKHLYEYSRVISYMEAGDSGQDSSYPKLLAEVKEMKRQLEFIEGFLNKNERDPAEQ